MATNGLVLIKPSSVAKTGASSTATINAGGSVTFDLCETLSLNDVFSSAYDNYIIDMRATNTVDGRGVNMRLRASGTDEASASNYYTHQRLLANGTSVSGSRGTDSFSLAVGVVDSRVGGLVFYLYGVALSQPTAFRSTPAGAQNAAIISDTAGTHSLSTAYDGFTFYPSSGAMSGLIKVYGLVK